ncbi:ATP-binding protein [Kineosporia succinea]|uniref:AAA+ superfamily ATPase n=1 Tax=Kineosporia succinea TaxID=84632 RepID=A0ABT9P6X6_9ACTN|nr:DUF4143 domain-containing protein [Kineosporia succinea]MDP9828454.1 putative AAA+ superfamily ATPase [Kineosporia succinea]
MGGEVESTHDFRSGYVRRVVDDLLDELLPSLPAILLDGPKAVGKTATALQRAETVWRLSRPAQASVVNADPQVALDGPAPVLLDEYQRVPSVFDAVRDAVDEDAEPGRFLLTGSAPPPGSHSGAGRITTVRMRPLTLPERGVSAPSVSLSSLFEGTFDAPVAGASVLGLKDYADLILRSGFPGLQHLPARALQIQLDGYVERIVDRDMSEGGHNVRRPATLMAWLRAYAAAASTTTNWDKIRDATSGGSASKPARSTTLPYIDTLTRLRILDEVPPWIPSRNHLKRLTQAPKHHLVDPALAARLVGATRASLLRGAGQAFTPEDGTYLGQLFESLATMSVRVFAEVVPASVSHLRLDSGRREVDLIVERDLDRAVVAFEVKLAGDIGYEDVKHLLWLREELGEQLVDAVVLTTGPAAYRRPDGIAVVPLGLLGP